MGGPRTGSARGIRAGKKVQQGQVIGYLGSTGLVTAPHLDYRIKVGGRFVNPRRIKLPSKEPVPSAELDFFNVTKNAYLLSLFEGLLAGENTLVEKPRPPMQKRMAAMF